MTIEIVFFTYNTSKRVLLDSERAILQAEKDKVYEREAKHILLYAREIGESITDLYRVFVWCDEDEKNIINSSFRTGNSGDFEQRISPYECLEVIKLGNTLLKKLKVVSNDDMLQRDCAQLQEKIKELRSSMWQLPIMRRM